MILIIHLIMYVYVHSFPYLCPEANAESILRKLSGPDDWDTNFGAVNFKDPRKNSSSSSSPRGSLTRPVSMNEALPFNRDLAIAIGHSVARDPYAPVCLPNGSALYLLLRMVFETVSFSGRNHFLF